MMSELGRETVSAYAGRAKRRTKKMLTKKILLLNMDNIIFNVMGLDLATLKRHRRRH